MTDDADIQYVIDGELRLHSAAVRNAPGVAGTLLDPEFYEFGASGRAWDRASVLDVMARDTEPPPVTDNLVATRLAADVIMLTYRTRSPGRTALRISLWRRQGDGPWLLYFHQGTLQAEDQEPPRRG